MEQQQQQPFEIITAPPTQTAIIEDAILLDVYQELLQMGRDDRRECDGYITNFAELVINEGDSTTSSKEALVNLMKVKSDVVDKMAKIAAEMTRLKLKETTPIKVNTARQENVTVNIGTNDNKRALIELIENMTKANEPKKEKVEASEESKKKTKKEDTR